MEKKIVYNKERGIKGCMADGWKMLALNWKSYVKQLWAYVLFAGLANAFFIEILLQYVCEQAMPAYLLFTSEGDLQTAKWMATPTWCNGIYMLLATLLFVFANLCVGVRYFSVINYYKANNCMPKTCKLALQKCDWQCMGRIVRALLCTALPACLISALVVFLALKYTLWLLVVVLLIGVFMSSCSTLCTMKYGLSNRTLIQSLKYAFKHALGIPFILMLLVLIPTTFCTLVLSLPETLYILSRMAATKSMLGSDSFGLPSYLPFVFFIANALCYALIGIARSYFVWTLSLKTNNNK